MVTWLDSDDARWYWTFNREKFLTDLRGLCGKRLRDIQAVTGISASTFSRIQNGKYPDIVTLIAVCNKLHLELTDYFDCHKVYEV